VRILNHQANNHKQLPAHFGVAAEHAATELLAQRGCVVSVKASRSTIGSVIEVFLRWPFPRESTWLPGLKEILLSNVSYIYYVCFFGLIERAWRRFEMLPANSSEASLLLKSATSTHKMYLLCAIKWVRSHASLS